jgi:hypothetical protein
LYLSKTISVFPKWALWTRRTFRIVDAFLVRATENLLHHDKGVDIMLAQSRKNALLNVYFVARIRILAKIPVNNTFVPISEKNAKNGFAGVLIVWPIKGKRSSRKAPIPLFCALSQYADGLRHGNVA